MQSVVVAYSGGLDSAFVLAVAHEVLGERAWPSLKDLPELPEHAYIVASTEATMEAIEECATLGVPVVSVARGVFYGVGLTAIVQGALVGIGFAIAGLPSPVVFGVVAAVVPSTNSRGASSMVSPASPSTRSITRTSPTETFS